MVVYRDIDFEDMAKALKNAGSTRRTIDRNDHVKVLKELGSTYRTIDDNDLSELTIGNVGSSTTAAVTFDATDVDAGTIGPGGTYTFALTVAAASGAQRVVMLAAIAGDGAGADFTACTIDGQAGTRLGSVVLGPSNSGARAVLTAYRATGTANTSINVVVTGGVQSSFSGYCSCWKLTGAGTVLATASSIVVDPTLSVNTATGGVVVAGAFGYDVGGGATAVWTGLTENFDHIQVFANDSFSGASANIATGATPRTISMDWTPDPTNSFAALAISFNPA